MGVPNYFFSFANGLKVFTTGQPQAILQRKRMLNDSPKIQKVSTITAALLLNNTNIVQKNELLQEVAENNKKHPARKVLAGCFRCFRSAIL